MFQRNETRKIWIAVIAVLSVVLLVVIGIAVFKNSSAQRYRRQLKLAEKYLDELDYDRAIAAYNAAIEIDPKRPEAYEELASVYIDLGEDEEAVKILDKGIKNGNREELEKMAEEVQHRIEKTTSLTADTEKEDTALIDADNEEKKN